MAKKSAGLLLYRYQQLKFQVLLVHPGGPFWAKKDKGAWSIPKGEFEDGEPPLEAAIREVKEELNLDVSGDFLPLTPVKQKSGKIIYTWALKADLDVATVVSNTFEMEWPPRSGKKIQVPEVDRAEWLSLNKAKEKIIPGQVALLDELIRMIDACPLF